MANRLLVSVVHNQPTIYTAAAKSLIEIGWGTRVAEAKRLYDFDEIGFQLQTEGARVDVLRNQAVRDARAFEASHLLFLDADMAFPNDLLPRFLMHASDPWAIVGGLYHLKGPPFSPVALIHERYERGMWWFDFLDLPIPPPRDLIPVDVIGMGCTLIPMTAFDTAEPWFYYRDDVEGEARVSEDVAFCQDARRRGLSIALDPTVVCQHFTVEGRSFDTYREYRRGLEAMAAQMACRVSRI